MSTWIIGDVQGCYIELQQLLEKISYNPDRDRLCFVGDLVNRGPDSLTVLRFLKQLRNVQIVLGNHDLYLLILGYGLMPLDAYSHTLHEVIDAPDRFALLDWLRYQPLLHHYKAQQAVLVHAGLPPQWSVPESLERASEVEDALQGSGFKNYLLDLFGNTPATWREALDGQDRLRYITNALTRMRVCQQDGTLDFRIQDPRQIASPLERPWFQWRDPAEAVDIFFGHWAMLGGHCASSHCHALDTGCAWGERLTAMRLEDRQRCSVNSTIKR